MINDRTSAYSQAEHTSREPWFILLLIKDGLSNIFLVNTVSSAMSALFFIILDIVKFKFNARSTISNNLMIYSISSTLT